MAVPAWLVETGLISEIEEHPWKPTLLPTSNIAFCSAIPYVFTPAGTGKKLMLSAGWKGCSVARRKKSCYGMGATGPTGLTGVGRCETLRQQFCKSRRHCMGMARCCVLTSRAVCSIDVRKRCRVLQMAPGP